MVIIKSNDRFGINIMKSCEQHENYVREQLAGGKDLERLLSLHNRKIEWLQHERIVHLIVTFLVSVLFLFLFALVLCAKGGFPVIILLAVVFVLLGAYILHYFRLENTVQHWYKISDDIFLKISEK